MHSKHRVLFILLFVLLMFGIATPALAGEAVFILGNQYEEVKQIQNRLRELGYLDAGATGYFGSATQDAIIRFQQDNGLTADGKAGPATQRALLGKVFQSSDVRAAAQQAAGQPAPAPTAAKATPTPAAEVNPPAESIPAAQATPQPNTQADVVQLPKYPLNQSSQGNVLAYGDSGEGVTRIQTRLIELGYMKVSATGYFGNYTLEAVRAFQQDNGLSVDGIVGWRTEKALFGEQSGVKAAEENVGAKAATSSNTSAAGNGGKNANTGSTTSTANAGSTGTGKGANTVQLARQHLGKPYVWGGKGPGTFDCSGLVRYVLAKQGMDSIHNSHMMSLNTKWKQVSLAELKPGDLVFFDTRKDNIPIGHVGIYSGNGNMVHASSDSGMVVESSMNTPYFKARFRIARRVFS